MRQTDPRDHLWENISRLAGVPGGSARDVADKLKGKFSVTTLQRLLKNASAPRTDTLLEIAKGLEVEVWELLVPPGGQEATPAKPMALEDALKIVGQALSRMTDAERRKYALQTLGEYASDPADNQIALDHVHKLLGGAPPEAAKLKHAA